MFARAATTRVLELSRAFPAVVLLGARQVGKTTLARSSFPDFSYVDLQDPRLTELFRDDPRFQVESRSKNGIILDEAQIVPALFPALRGLIDADRAARGRFVLLGSAQPTIVRGISESLAGRVGILELDPLTLAEVGTGPKPVEWRRLWLRGGFPDSVRGPFREWQEAYLRTFVERDIAVLGLPVEPILARRVLTMLAHQQGGLLNTSALCAALGVSHGKVTRILDIFEGTFLLRRLPPYFRNVGKRLTKSPKAYLRDTGMLHHLLHVNSEEGLQDHPIRGASWETLVIEDIIRRERIIRPHTQFFFWRTAAGAEVDLVLDRGSSRVAIEVKAGVGDAKQAARLADAARDIGAESSWLLDQGQGEEAMRPDVWRRSFVEDPLWLPP